MSARSGRAALERRLWLFLTVLAFVFLTGIVARAQEQPAPIRAGDRAAAPAAPVLPGA